MRKVMSKQWDPITIGLYALYAFLPFHMDENGIQKFVSTVTENMLPTDVGRAAHRNYSLNTNSSYQNHTMTGGTYWKVLEAVHDVGPKIVLWSIFMLYSWMMRFQ
jgi:hypothetical protein